MRGSPQTDSTAGSKPVGGVARGSGRLGAVVAGVSLAGALVSLGGGLNDNLDVASHLAPVWLAGGASAAALLSLGERSGFRSWLWTGLALLAVFLAALLIVPEFTRPIRPSVPPGAEYKVKLIEYNAWVGNTHEASDALWLASQHPDFILITDARPALVAGLEQWGFHYRKGIADTAIFSRVAVTRDPYKMPASEWPLLPSLARATFAGPGGPFTLIAAHLPRPIAKPEDGVEDALLRLATHYDRSRLIVAGDFNLTPWSHNLRRFDRAVGIERRDRALFSWPSRVLPWPILPIDHVYAGSAWRTVSLTRGPKLGSDHYPIIAVLALAG